MIQSGKLLNVLSPSEYYILLYVFYVRAFRVDLYLDFSEYNKHIYPLKP